MPELPSIAICGLARNAGLALEPSLLSIERLCAAAEQSHVFVVTNDNHDETGHILQAWTKATSGRTLINLDGAAAALPDRIDRLAFARNSYLLAMRALKSNPTFVIIMDLDGPNVSLAREEVIDSIQSAPSEWGAIFANQLHAYYDLYALRRKGWIEGDVWQEVDQRVAWLLNPAARFANRLSGRRLARQVQRRTIMRTVHDRQYRIDRDVAFIEVESAFGGMGIYQFDAIEECWYGSRNAAGILTCEHVIFNQQVHAKGRGLYICPLLTNVTPLEHVGPSSGAPMPNGIIS